MEQLIIKGNNKLEGKINIGGAKNAALKLMAASLLTKEEVILKNVPLIKDVYTMADALRSLGAEVNVDDNQVSIKAANLLSCTAPYELVSKMRASILVMGPLLARLGRSKAAMPGGCKIGLRKIDLHIKGLESLGAEISIDHGYIDARAKALFGSDFYLDFPSVGATENMLMAAVLAKGTTFIKNAAREPEIVDLANFLNNLGAKIIGAGDNTITIEGVNSLRGGEYSVMSDRIEAGTFLIAGALVGKNLEICNFNPQDLFMTITKLKDIGVDLKVNNDSLIIKESSRLNPCTFSTLPHPGFPTDLQGPMMVLLSLVNGQSVITENVFENRFLLVEELNKMGAKIQIQGHRALIKGVDELSASNVDAPDLRGGAALVLAGLVANGETVVSNIDHIDRGYEKLEEKFKSIGANIIRKKVVLNNETQNESLESLA